MLTLIYRYHELSIHYSLVAKFMHGHS